MSRVESSQPAVLPKDRRAPPARRDGGAFRRCNSARRANGSTSRNGMASAACFPATAARSTCARNPARTSRAIFPSWSTPRWQLKATDFVLDGEIVVPRGKAFSFDDLLQRIHPAASRMKKLSQETPALFLAFDLLATAKDNKLAAQPLRERRPALEAFAKTQFKSKPTFRLSPATTSYATAKKWLAQSGGGSRRRDRQTHRPALSVRQPRRHAEDQEIPQRRLRGRRLSLRDQQARRQQGRRLAAARPLRRRGIAAPCRLHLRDQAARKSRR